MACAISSSSFVGTTITVTGEPSGEMTRASGRASVAVRIDGDAEPRQVGRNEFPSPDIVLTDAGGEGDGVHRPQHGE